MKRIYLCVQLVMGEFSRDEINNIKAQITLSAIVGATVDLTLARSRDYQGCCPFHSEKTASFRVDDQRYHCFGCHAHGDIFSWISLTQGVSFPEAIRRAADLIGTTPTPTSPQRQKEPPPDPAARGRIITTCTAAQEFFTGWQCNYLSERFSDEARRAFGIAYATSGRRAVVEWLSCKHFTNDEILEAQLAASDIQSGEIYSRYRDRITIPLKDEYGNILGFLGRIVPSEANKKLPKYLCPRNSAAFNKKNFLFGVDQLKGKRVESLIVVEGSIDAISLWDKGVKNVVATLGCDLSSEQARLLAKYTDKVYVMYDGDQAGINGMSDIGMDTTLPFKCRALLLPPGQDPDSFANQHKDGTRDALKLLPNVPISAIARGVNITLWHREMSKPEYDISELQRLAKPYVDDNIKQGYVQYNVVDWCVQAYPQYATTIKATLSHMLKNAEVLEGGKKRLRTDDVKTFLKEWIKPCRDVRRVNAD